MAHLLKEWKEDLNEDKESFVPTFGQDRIKEKIQTGEEREG